jgi:hypothetical protein
MAQAVQGQKARPRGGGWREGGGADGNFFRGGGGNVLKLTVVMSGP